MYVGEVMLFENLNVLGFEYTTPPPPPRYLRISTIILFATFLAEFGVYFLKEQFLVWAFLK